MPKKTIQTEKTEMKSLLEKKVIATLNAITKPKGFEWKKTEDGYSTKTEPKNPDITEKLINDTLCKKGIGMTRISSAGLPIFPELTREQLTLVKNLSASEKECIRKGFAINDDFKISLSDKQSVIEILNSTTGRNGVRWEEYGDNSFITSELRKPKAAIRALNQILEEKKANVSENRVILSNLTEENLKALLNPFEKRSSQFLSGNFQLPKKHLGVEESERNSSGRAF